MHPDRECGQFIYVIAGDSLSQEFERAGEIMHTELEPYIALTINYQRIRGDIVEFAELSVIAFNTISGRAYAAGCACYVRPCGMFTLWLMGVSFLCLLVGMLISWCTATEIVRFEPVYEN